MVDKTADGKVVQLVCTTDKTRAALMVVSTVEQMAYMLAGSWAEMKGQLTAVMMVVQMGS